MTRFAIAAAGVLVTLSSSAPRAGAAPGYDWPLQPRPRVVTAYDPPAQRWLSGHRGVDLAGDDGQPVLAAGAGTVVFAGRVGGKPVVSIRHSPVLWTTYEPVQPRVRAGDAVVRGTVLGLLQSGHEGCPVTACLHWGARTGSGPHAGYRNPLGLVGALRVRLYPVPDGR